MMIDLDHFKTVNDRFGHPVGDMVLKKTTSTIAHNLRTGDIAVRIGGEEFALFLIMDSRKDAEKIAERIRENVSHTDFSVLMGEKKQTISGGLVFREKKESLESLISRADQNLYRAKSEGRNRIVSS